MEVSWFDKLRTGLLTITIKGELRQPHNYAMEKVPSGYSRWQISQQYFNEVERIMRELKVAHSFVSQMPDDEFLKKHNISHENYIMYHQGYFLDLTHQLKDKLCQMIRATVTPEKDYKKQKLEDSTKLSRLLKDKYVIRIPGLVSLLGEWDSDKQNGTISKALKKRTNYHHFKNPLPYVESYSQASSLRSFLDPKFSDKLTEYGKQTLSEKADKNLQLWQSDGSAKMGEVIKEVDLNLNNISKALVKYYKFPSFVRSADLINRYLKISEKIRIKKSSYNEESIPKEYRDVFDILKSILTPAFKDNLSAVYVVGSILRNDFIHGLSDINIVIVVKEGMEEQKILAGNLILNLSKQLKVFIENKIITEDEFKSTNFEKVRFICRSDGFLLIGSDLLSDEIDLKTCYNLAWILNKDFKEYLLNMKAELLEVGANLNEYQLATRARSLAKRAYWMSFSMVIGNELIYDSNFKKMRYLQNFFYPENRVLNERTYRLITRRMRIDCETLLILLEKYEELLLPLYKKIQNLCDQGDKQLRDIA